MLQKSLVIFGALAAAATLGAVQFASGHDLADRFQALTEPHGNLAISGASAINRTAKADREAAPKAADEARTVQLKIESLADTSVLIRIPVQKDARNLPPLAPSAKPAGDRSKRMVACEPVVSVLTEVAKLLQPGRCVT